MYKNAHRLYCRRDLADFGHFWVFKKIDQNSTVFDFDCAQMWSGGGLVPFSVGCFFFLRIFHEGPYGPLKHEAARSHRTADPQKPAAQAIYALSFLGRFHGVRFWTYSQVVG